MRGEGVGEWVRGVRGRGWVKGVDKKERWKQAESQIMRVGIA